MDLSIPPGAPVTDARRSFNDAYASAFATPPPLPFMAETYDAVALIALAADKAGIYQLRCAKHKEFMRALITVVPN